MPSAKEQIAKIIQDQSDECSYDEILRDLVFVRMIDRGLADSDAQRTTSHEEMGRRIKTIKPRAGWAEAAKRMRSRDEDRLIDSPDTNPFQ